MYGLTWRPVTGENAWAITALLQAAYLKYNGKIPAQSNELKVAESIVPAMQALQTKIGAILYAPEGTFGADPGTISNENNFSAYAALRMANQATGKPLYLQMMQAQEQFLRNYGFDKANNLFYQGGIYRSGKFIPERAFAVDCQTWAISVLGPEVIDRWFGDGTAYKMWK
ncbi:MAG: hypothetical protein Q8O12_04970, partial [Candidatus Omnitrophota bacterium]|nr:hypothetical protein [Candidatus Omnitrophota bacterium]